MRILEYADRNGYAVYIREDQVTAVTASESPGYATVHLQGTTVDVETPSEWADERIVAGDIWDLNGPDGATLVTEEWHR